MNKEKIYKILENNLDIISCREVINYIEELQEENENLKADYGSKSQVERDLLQQRLDKAIKYINNNDLLFELLQNEKVKNELLSILENKEVEDNE